MKPRREDFSALRNCSIFQELDDASLDRVACSIDWRNYRRGTDVFRYRDAGENVYVIATGRVRVTIFSREGKEITYRDLSAGETFGELSVIDDHPRTASVIALEPSRIGTMPGCDFLALLAQHPGVALAVLRRLASIIRHLTERIYEFGALDVRDRVRAEILRLALPNRSNDETVVIDPFPTHAEIANRISTHREAVTRELNDLTRSGIISQNRRRLTVHDISRLADMLPEVL